MTSDTEKQNIQIRNTNYSPLRPWAELNVRPWLILAVLMTLVVGWLVGHQWTKIRDERRLIESGTPVQAKVIQIGLARERQAGRDESQRVVLQYNGPKGQRVESLGMLPRLAGGIVKLDDVLNVRIDPADPAKWTERSRPPNLLAELLVPLLLVPPALLCVAAAVWQWRRVVSAVRNGERKTGAVASVKQSSIAPLSKHLGVTLEGDRRVRHCYWPSNKLGPVHKGDVIDLIVGRNGIVVPAKSYGLE